MITTGVDNESIRNGLMLVQWLTTLVLAVYAHNIGKARATTESIDGLKKEMAEKCLRIAKLEGEIKALPTAEKLETWNVRVHERIDEMKSASAETNLLLGDVSGQLKQINDRLAKL